MRLRELCTRITNNLFVGRELWKEIESFFRPFRYEKGGILGLDRHWNISFEKDERSSFSIDSYTPDYKRLERVINRWARGNIAFCGFIHSHSNGNGVPSKEDLDFYIEFQRRNPSLCLSLMGIAHQKDEGFFVNWFTFEDNLFSDINEKVILSVL